MAVPAAFRTPLTERLGIAHPILLGGMHHLGQSALVAAVCRAGALGFVTPRSFDTLEEFRADLRRCAELAEGHPFGVNLTISRRPGFNDMVPAWIDTALDAGVRVFESAGASPEDIIGPIHAAGALLIHKCPSVRHALSAERLGVDFVALVGMEEGGHPGANPLPTFVNGAAALARLTTPVILGGGIGSGRMIAAALAMGAAGVVMGSRFMVATEAPVHDALKHHILGLDENCSMAVLGTLGDTWRVMVNDTARRVQQLERDGARDHRAFGDLILSSRTRELVYRQGRVDDGIVSLGPAGGFSQRIESAHDIVATLVAEAKEATQAYAARVID